MYQPHTKMKGNSALNDYKVLGPYVHRPKVYSILCFSWILIFIHKGFICKVPRAKPVMNCHNQHLSTNLVIYWEVQNVMLGDGLRHCWRVIKMGFPQSSSSDYGTCCMSVTLWSWQDPRNPSWDWYRHGTSDLSTTLHARSFSASCSDASCRGGPSSNQGWNFEAQCASSLGSVRPGHHLSIQRV